MNLSANWSIVAAVVFALIAYALGRNPLLWGLFGYLTPMFAGIFLFIRHRNVPRESPEWILNFVSRVKLKMWARDLKPEDFHTPPKSDEA